MSRALPARLGYVRFSPGVRLPAARALRGRAKGARVLALLLVPALLLLAGQAFRRGPAAQQLSDYELRGDRGPGCIRLALLTDQSGSMTQYTAARDAALTRILAWTPGQLRSNDQLAAVDWATDARTLLPTTRVDSLRATLAVGASSLSARSSELLPGLRRLAAEPGPVCRTVVVVISDGLLTEQGQGDAMEQLLTAAEADTVVLLRPSTKLSVPRQWKDQLPYARSVAVDGRNPDAVAVALGQELARVTGQKLVERRRS